MESTWDEKSLRERMVELLVRTGYNAVVDVDTLLKAAARLERYVKDGATDEPPAAGAVA